MSAAEIAAMTLLALVAAGAVLLPLVRRPRRTAGSQEHDLAVYRDQLEEVEREVAAGRLQPEQAARARAEIERRILKVADQKAPDRSESPERPMPRFAAWALALSVPLVATILYLDLGSPGMPDVPLASRQRADPAQVAQREEFGRLTERLADRLRRGEGDLTGWMMLARSYRALGRTEESVAAFRKAVDLAGGVGSAPAALLEDFGEALFMASGAQVTSEARAAFEAALDREPGRFKSRHYLAVAALQAGRAREALAIWRGIEGDSPAGAPWLPELRQRIDALAGEIGIAAAEVAPARTAAPVSEAPPGGPTGPSRADMEAAAAMSPEQRAAFIQGMVERLATRLEESPDDAEGWARLARAYSVLGNAEKAEEARRHAVAEYRKRLDALPPDAPERTAIEARIAALDRES